MVSPDRTSGCALCGRAVPHLTEHHLIPRARGKKGQVLPVVWLCPACHKQLHALFTLDQLATELNTVEALRQQPDMARFIKWVRKQPPTKGVRVRR